MTSTSFLKNNEVFFTIAAIASDTLHIAHVQKDGITAVRNAVF